LWVQDRTPSQDAVKNIKSLVLSDNSMWIPVNPNALSLTAGLTPPVRIVAPSLLAFDMNFLIFSY